MKVNATLYPYQKAGVAFAYEKKYGLLGDRMGLGKSLQFLALCAKLHDENPKARFLVVCPAFLCTNWRAEISKFLGDEYHNHFDVCSYESLKHYEEFFPSYLAVAADEVHYLKNTKAKRTQTFHDFIEDHRPKYFLGLSGTPIKNRVPEFYSLLKLCWLGGLYPEFSKFSRSEWLFTREFTNLKILRIGLRKIQKPEGIRNVEALKALIKPVYLRRRAEDVLDLPPVVRQEVLIADKAKTDTLLAMAWEAYESGTKSQSFSSGKAVSALAKTAFTVEYVNEVLQTTQKVIIFSDHVQAVKKIHSEFPPEKARYLTGETPAHIRKEIVDSFNDDDVDILVMTFGAGAVGFNITGANYMVFNDVPWVPADWDQAEKRMHRIGQDKTCFYAYIMASKVDQRIFRTLQAKRKIIEKVDV